MDRLHGKYPRTRYSLWLKPIWVRPDLSPEGGAKNGLKTTGAVNNTDNNI